MSGLSTALEASDSSSKLESFRRAASGVEKLILRNKSSKLLSGFSAVLSPMSAIKAED